VSNIDHRAVTEAVHLAASPWRHEAPRGREALAALVERHGREAVLAAIGDESPEARICQLDLRAAAGEDVTYGLADHDHAVAFTAQSLIGDENRLRAYIADEAPTDDAKLWAAYRLFLLVENGDEEIRAIYDALGRPRVEVPGLDEDIRRAIVHDYGGIYCQRGTDPRWRIEMFCTEPPAPVNEDSQLIRAAEALVAAGLEPQPPCCAGDFHLQGGGTYNVIDVGDIRLKVSTLGWYATVHTRPGHTGEPDPVVRQAMEGAGFRWIDDDLSGIVVTGLCVYFFGARDPLSVGDLLFYRQD
jgi:hypothetical protein